MFYARKVNLAKWRSREGVKPGEIPADAVTGDLRTQKNSLSFWKCRSRQEEHTEQIALAMAAAGDYIDRIELVLIPEGHLMKENRNNLHDTEARTPYRDIANQHCDLAGLDGVRLVRVANLIAGAIMQDDLICTVPKGRIMEMTREAVEQELIDLDDLSEGLRKKIFS